MSCWKTCMKLAQVAKDGKGYLEDRRPAANSDPYVVTERICKTVILNE